MKIRAFMIISVLLLAVFPFQPAVLAQGAPERIRISYSSGGMTSIDLFIARDRKYFQQQNLNGELIRMSANLAISAGISGDVDQQAARPLCPQFGDGLAQQRL